MSTHAREYWLNVQAKEAARIAMEMAVSHSEISEAIDNVSPDSCRVDRIDAAGVAYSDALHEAARALALAEQLHRLWVGMEDV